MKIIFVNIQEDSVFDERLKDLKLSRISTTHIDL